MKPGLEVFDFTVEDDLLEFSSGKYGRKYVHQSDSPKNNCAISCVSKYDLPIFEDMQKTGAVSSVSSHQLTNDSTSRRSNVEFEIKNVNFEVTTGSATSPINKELGIDDPMEITYQLTSVLVVDSETHGKLENEVLLPTYFDSVVSPQEVSFPAKVDISHFPAPDRESVCFLADYLVYRDEYFTGCAVIFTSIGMEVNLSSLNNPDVASKFERSLDDIVQIQFKQLRQFYTVIVTVKKSLEGATFLGNELLGMEVLEFSVVDPEWSKTLEDMMNLSVKFTTLCSAVDDEVSMNDESSLRKPYFPRFDDTFEDVIYPEGESDAVSISRRDADLLQPESFVNDTIIDFYIKYLQTQIPKEQRRRFHFFNSFFFRKLADLDKDPSHACDGRAAFLRVKKWTRKVDLFAKDFVFTPVNFNLHWSLLVFCHLGEVVSFDDAERQSILKIPCILHMDSLRGTHNGLKSIVQSYLWEEWKDRHEESTEDLSSKFLNLRFVSLELPQQENLYDCGLFLLHYLEQFLAEAPLSFNPFSIDEDSNLLTADWFPPAEASLKRVLIQRLISTLLEIRSQAALQNAEENSPIEVTLPESSVQAATDPGLVLEHLFYPKDPSCSLLENCPPAFQPNCADVNGLFCGLKDDELSEEPLSGSDDSDVGIIENLRSHDADVRSPLRDDDDHSFPKRVRLS